MQYGINVKKTNEYMTSKCKRSMFPYFMKFNRMVSSDKSKLNTFHVHSTSCSGACQLFQNDTNGTGGRNYKYALCTPVYTKRALSRCIWDDYIYNPILATKKIVLLVKSKGVYITQPCIRHFAAVKRGFQQLMQTWPAEDIAEFW